MGAYVQLCADMLWALMGTYVEICCALVPSISSSLYIVLVKLSIQYNCINTHGISMLSSQSTDITCFYQSVQFEDRITAFCIVMVTNSLHRKNKQFFCSKVAPSLAPSLASLLFSSLRLSHQAQHLSLLLHTYLPSLYMSPLSLSLLAPH